MISTKSIDIFGVPIDFGAGRRGVDMGPSAIRVAGLDDQLRALGHEVVDLGNLQVHCPETEDPGSGNMRFKEAILATSREIAQGMQRSLALGRFPLVLGGDHSIALGTVGGTACHFATRGEKVGLLWFDAHGDCNTPDTSPSGNIHGMPLAASLGLGHPDLTGIGDLTPKIDPANAVLIGARDLDRAEKKNIRDLGVTVYTMREIDHLGIHRVVEEAVARASSGTEGIHVSFDLDVIDPEFAPGTGTPVLGGLSYREAHLAMEIACEKATVVSLDLVEVNPILDVRNHTACLAAELALSLLGKNIL